MNKAKASDKFTVCTKCRFLINLDPGSPRKHVWYNNLCQAAPLPTARDPYDGQVKPYTGGNYPPLCFVDEKFTYCKVLNKDGNCPKYKPKHGV